MIRSKKADVPSVARYFRRAESALPYLFRTLRLIQQAAPGWPAEPIALLETLGGLLRNGVTLIAMVMVLAGFWVWLPAALLASTLPELVIVLRDAVRQHQFRIRATPLERRASYYDWLLTTGDTAPE